MTDAEQSPRYSPQYYVLTGGLAILFLFPLAWSVFASVSPAANTGQLVGYGFGNFTKLFTFGAGLGITAWNSLFMSIMTVVITLTLSTLGLPLEGVGLLLAIDPILDMGRTAVNVAGQALVPTIVAKREGIIDLAVYNSERTGQAWREDAPTEELATAS
jgi:hypothetical protein